MSRERLALVTGTSSGIGEAVARALLGRRWQVIGVARRAPTIEGRYRHLALDLADASTAAPTIERALAGAFAERGWERIGLINNAATALPGRVRDLEAAELARAFTLDIAMPLWLMGLVLRLKPAATLARVVNISSGAAHRAVPGLAAYCAAKAALRMAGMAVASELEEGMALFSYEPGVVDTEMQRTVREMPPKAFPSSSLFRQYHAEGRLVSPELPAADIVEFLESEGDERFLERRRN
ncbi:MAG: SDR family NAD(P)-dependent oxidoreductase [Burkholderiales bacterium]